MKEHQSQIRELERKYRRLKRQNAWEQKKRRLPLLCGIVLLAAAAVTAVWFLTQPRRLQQPEALRITVLDVGQGDAILLQTASHQVLLDAGETDQGETVVQDLKQCGVRRLDCVICSHPHADHIGGLPAVLEAFPVGRLYLPHIPAEQTPTGYTFEKIMKTAGEKSVPVRMPECGETLLLGAASLTFLSVENSAFEELNDCSLGCRVECGSISFFSAGDLSAAGEEAFLAARLVQPATILKVSHHGSGASTSGAFLAALRPQYAAISCGAQNDYGHPAEKTLQALHDAGCSVYRTDLDGTVTFETDGAALVIETENGQ